MIISQEYIISQLKEHPDGCSIAELVNMDCHPFNDRTTILQNYRDKLNRLRKRGYVIRSGRGTPNNPYIWRVSE